MAILPKAIYRLIAILIKIPVSFFKEIEQKNHQIYTEPQKSTNSQSNSEKKNEGKGITLLDFKLYYRATIIKTSCCLQKNRHTDQWNRIETPDMKPHVYG